MVETKDRQAYEQGREMREHDGLYRFINENGARRALDTESEKKAFDKGLSGDQLDD